MFTVFGYWFWFGDVNSPLMLSSWAGRIMWVLVVIAHSDVCVIYAGGVAVLVWLCWWCCWSTRVLGRPVSHTVTLLYFPLEF
jgi:hypothetical protein